MHTHSDKVYNPDKPNIDMDPNTSSSGITSPTDYLIPKILKILEKIKAQLNTLDQRINIKAQIEVERRDRGRNEDRQLSQRQQRSTRITIDTMMMNGT